MFWGGAQYESAIVFRKLLLFWGMTEGHEGVWWGQRSCSDRVDFASAGFVNFRKFYFAPSR